MIKLNDIYALKGTATPVNSWVIQDHWFSELSSLSNNLNEIADVLEQEGRLTLKCLVNKNYDGERIATMFSVWFDDKPVLLVQDAGRGGRDHQQRWVTGHTAYLELLTYLMAHLLKLEPDTVEDPQSERYEEEVLRFYGTDFGPELGFESAPRREDVLLLPCTRGLLSSVPPDHSVAMLKIGAKDLPEYVRRGAAVLQKVRLLSTEELQADNPRIVEGNNAEGLDRVYLFKPCERPLGALVQSI